MNPEIETLGKKLEELFGENLADPEVFPRIFAHQVKFARYEIWRASQESTT